MNLEGKKVLVTGAGGFIGSHLVEDLARAGAQVRAFLHYNSRDDCGFVRDLSDELKGKVELFFGDIRELETVRDAVRGMQLVFNLAALVGIPYSYDHPQEVVQTNTVGTMNILISSKDEGIEKIVQTSTSEVYGSALYVPIDEKHPLQPQSPYSASKIGSDSLALSFYHTYSLPVAVIRPFNAFGPRQSARAVIPTIITQALTKDKIKLGNLDAMRDFTYVSDTVNGFIMIACSEKSTGEVLNIGSGKSISIKDLVDIILEVSDSKASIELDAQRLRPEKSEVTRLCANNQKAKEVVGWEPKVTIEEGLRRTVEYISKNISLYSPDKYVK